MSTTITGTLVDKQGQVWSLASVQFRLRKNPDSNDFYTVNGSPFNTTPPAVITDSAGKFTITVPANNEISPDNSSWLCTIAPDASSEAVTLLLKVITGTLDISSLFTNTAQIFPVQSKYMPRAYSDSEVKTPPNSGQLYYDVVVKTLKYWENNQWNPIGTGSGGGGMVYPQAGIAVSTGSSWSASLPTASLIPYPPAGLANSSGTGWLLPIDPTTLQRNISLTTTGTNGAATFTNNVLNIPQYAGASGGMVYPPSGIPTSSGSAWANSIPYSSNAAGTWTLTASGLNLLWNLSGGSGETDFVTAKGAGSLGGFNWYNGATGAVITSTTVPDMSLDYTSSLHVKGSENVGVNLTVVGTTTTGNNNLRLGDRAAAIWNTGSANINADTQSFVLNAPNGSGGTIFFNYDQAGGGVRFCNGAGVGNATIDGPGNGTFVGLMTARSYIATGGVNPSTPTLPCASLSFVTGENAATLFGNSNTSSNAGVELWGGNVTTSGAIKYLDLHQATGAVFSGNVTVPGIIKIGGSATITIGTGVQPTPSIRTDGSGNMVINASGGTYINWDGGNGLNIGNGSGGSVVTIDNVGNTVINGHIVCASNALTISARTDIGGGGCNINADSSNLFLNATNVNGGSGGGIYLNWDRGATGVHFGNGNQAQVAAIDGGGFGDFAGIKINGTGVNGQVLTGNGSSYVPMAPPPYNYVAANWVGGSRTFNTLYQNTQGRPMFVSGAGRTNGSSVGSMQCVIGGGSPPNVVAFCQTSGATVNDGRIGFHFVVPAGWYYQINANNQTNNQGNAVTGVADWVEIY